MKYRLLSIFYYFVISFGMTFPVISMPQKECPGGKDETDKRPGKAQAAQATQTTGDDSAANSPILSDSYLVHVTPIDPRRHDFTLVPGSIIQTLPLPGEKYNPAILPESLRTCLYFCINSYLPELRGGQGGNSSQYDVQERRYAVVIPFFSLQKRILNVYPTDTSVYGLIDLEVTPGAVLFVPKDEEEDVSLGKKTKIIPYQGRLCRAIENFFRDLNVPMIKMKECGPGMDPRLDQFYIGPNEIQKIIMSDPFFKEKPYVSYGLEDVAHTRTSVMPYFEFLHFLRVQFYQLYRKQKKTTLLPKKSYLSRCNALAYLELAELCQRNITNYFEKNDLNDAAKDFSERYGPIIRETLTNINAYISQYAEKPSFNNRVMDFSRIITIMGVCDVDEAIAFLSKPVFDEAREELMSLYWAFTSLSKDCFGVPYPEDSFVQFQKSVEVLKSKKPTWNRALYFAYLDKKFSLLGVQTNKSILHRYMEVLDPIVPPQAKIPFSTEKSREKMEITLVYLKNNGRGFSFLKKKLIDTGFICPDEREYWGL